MRYNAGIVNCARDPKRNRTMAAPMTVTFSGELSEKIQQLAILRHQEVSELFATLVDQAWPDETKEDADLEEQDETASPEMRAYVALHPMLKEKYFGQYVAIYKGKVIDHDADRKALYERIDAQYPDEFVWISRVEEEPIPTLVFRSPRIERHWVA
jgi:hypothetical protein